jgi:sialate O-acetylesterase
MKAGWRAQFGAATPFLIVQLPNFGEPVTQPTEAGWASLREAQRRSTLADPRAALVVAIDLGDASELHPPNKRGVGLRLARAARSLAYGEPLSPSGPQAVVATRNGGEVRIRFAGVTGRLDVRSDARPIAFELCGTGIGTCRFAEARIAGDGVTLTGANAVAATRVRYCWGDAPVCNLYDGDGLPAGPFELPIE